MSTVDQEDIKTRVNQQLRLADESVKNKQYDQALLIVRKVYSIDMKNMYARAYEERILALKLEEAGRQFGAWKKSLENPDKKNRVL